MVQKRLRTSHSVKIRENRKFFLDKLKLSVECAHKVEILGVEPPHVTGLFTISKVQKLGGLAFLTTSQY